MTRRVAGFLVAVVLAVLSVAPGCVSPAPGDPPDPLAGMWGTPAAEAGGFDRDALFGRWRDLDRDGCDTKQEVVARDSGATCPPRPADGVTIIDPYTGETVAGWDGIDGEHVVSLRYACWYGACGPGWDKARRVEFGNDWTSRVPGCPRCSQVVASDDSVNQRKGERGPSQFVPPTREGRCFYGSTFLAVTAHWGLVIPEADRVAAERMAAECPGDAR